MTILANSLSREARYQITGISGCYKVTFHVMASPCELLVKSSERQLVKQMAEHAVTETKRIELKYSRFIKGNMLDQINTNVDRWQSLDEETVALISFAKQCFELSEGLFDITAGRVLKLWAFHQGATVPEHEAITRSLKTVGFDGLKFNGNQIYIPKGVSLDLGGIGKEYACDRLAQYFSLNYPQLPVLVNLGGDISCSVLNKTPWRVGVESPEYLDHVDEIMTLSHGALATSGNSKRYIIHEGKRHGHIINPVTGYPIMGGPLCVTVKADNCLTAGMLSTIAMLQGRKAEAFLQSQGVEYKVVWSS